MHKSHWSNADFFTKSNRAYTYTHNNWDADIPLHSHEFYELNIVLRGSGTHTIGTRMVSTRTGDVFVIPPGVKHTYTPDGNLDIYHILMQADFLMQYFSDLQATPGFKTLFEIEPSLRESGGDFYLHLAPDELGELKDKLHKIAIAQANANFGYLNICILHLIGELSMKIHTRIDKSKSPSVTGALSVQHSAEYIQNHLEQKLSVGILADLCAVSEATYNRHFKKLLHCTPAAYIAAERLKKAKLLLAEKKHTKTEIAQLCGFFDVSHLNKYLENLK